jgi:hypothetical protein
MTTSTLHLLMLCGALVAMDAMLVGDAMDAQGWVSKRNPR